MALRPVSLDDTTGRLQAAAAPTVVGEGYQWYQTFTLHAVGVGQQDMPIWIPWNCTMTKWRFRVASVGTGGSMAADLRRNGIAGGNVLSGTSLTPSVTPSFTTGSISLSADDLLWIYVSTMSHTTVGAQLKAEIYLERTL
jgi:hypothetical protein